MSRRCGDCYACCVAMRIRELDKPAGVACRHLRSSTTLESSGLVSIGDKPCGIYSERPNPCRLFECLWLQSAFVDEELRPDRMGLVFWVPLPEHLPENIPPGREIFFAAEVWPGAMNEPLNKTVLEVLREKVIVIVFLFGEEKIGEGINV